MIALDDLKTALGVTHDEDDDYIVELEERAVDFVARATNRSFSTEAVTEYVRGDRTGTLWLAHGVASVTSVQSRDYPGGTLTTIAEADDDGFEVRDARLYRKNGDIWESGLEYKVVYVPSGTYPYALRQAVEQLVTRWYEMRLGLALGTVAPEVPQSVSEIIRTHRRPFV